MSALTVSGVRKSFGPVEVLHGIDLHVPMEGFTALLGPSGCGKTTLLRLVAGFADPDAGTIAFGDQIVVGTGRSMPAQKRRVGFVPQEGALFPHLRVDANIAFGLPRRGRHGRSRVGELLELVGLDAGLAQRYPHELSGGQQQRVALARALAPKPAIVLLDEPFSSLDAGLRESTRRAVLGALREEKTTTLLVTHDQAEALSMADEVAVMEAGRIVQRASPQTLYRRPTDLGVATFVGEAVLLAGTVHDGRGECALGSLPVVGSAGASGLDGEVRLLVRPEQIRLHDDPAPTRVAARVADLSYFGHDSAVRLSLLDGTGTVTARVLGAQAPRTGDTVWLSVEGDATAFPVS